MLSQYLLPNTDVPASNKNKQLISNGLVLNTAYLHLLKTLSLNNGKLVVLHWEMKPFYYQKPTIPMKESLIRVQLPILNGSGVFVQTKLV